MKKLAFSTLIINALLTLTVTAWAESPHKKIEVLEVQIVDLTVAVADLQAQINVLAATEPELEDRVAHLESFGIRYMDMGNGTVFYAATKLTIVKDASCLGFGNLASMQAAAIELGDGVCNISDGSSPGQWRLPTEAEMFSLVNGHPGTNGQFEGLYNAKNTTPWKQGDAFDNIVLRDWYWTSTNVNIIKNSYYVSHSIFYLEV